MQRRLTCPRYLQSVRVNQRPLPVVGRSLRLVGRSWLLYSREMSCKSSHTQLVDMLVKQHASTRSSREELEASLFSLEKQCYNTELQDYILRSQASTLSKGPRLPTILNMLIPLGTRQWHIKLKHQLEPLTSSHLFPLFLAQSLHFPPHQIQFLPLHS